MVEMDYVFLFYIFLSFVIASGGAFVFFSSGRTIAAILFLVGSTTAVVFFGYRWFKSTGKTTAVVEVWPPSINACPDFLSLYKDPSGNSVCVDTLGVATGSALTKWTSTSVPTSSNSFNLFTAHSGAKRTTALCDEAKAKKVTWEGVWDGTVCLGGQPPKP